MIRSFACIRKGFHCDPAPIRETTYPMNERQHSSVKILFALTLVHFTGDFYSSFTTPLFPAFMAKLNLSLAEVGLIAGINRFLAFIVQPVAGYMADRYQGRMIILGGLLMAVVFIPLSGIAGITGRCWCSSAWDPSVRPFSTLP